ncbi:nuclear transport factor 2 family protein [Comamonas kerstersii]
MTVSPEIHLSVQAGVQQLVYCYEHLTPQSLDSLKACYAPQARFKDPFNDVQGIERIAQVFEHMFSTVDAPRFQVTEQLLQGQQAFLAWEFHFRMRRWRKAQPQCIRGGTFLRLDARGKVLEHRDYWDSAEELYEKLPVLGALMRWLRKAGSATG